MKNEYEHKMIIWYSIRKSYNKMAQKKNYYKIVTQFKRNDKLLADFSL